MTRFRCLFLTPYLLCLVFSASAQAEAMRLIGKLTQGSMISGQTLAKSEVYLNDEPLILNEQGQFVFGFGRDAALTQTLRWRLPNGVEQTETLHLEKREYAIQRIEGVPQKTVTPPANPKLTERIRSETAMVKQARKARSTRTDVYQPFKVPLDGPITGVYGSQRVYNGTPKRPHYGLDYAAPVGTLVYAPVAGVVTLTHKDMFYSGGTLIVDHGYGVSSTFIHLSEVLVQEGDEVKQGDPIAKVGKGGRATGPHLDWRINWFKERLDPALVLEKEKFILDL